MVQTTGLGWSRHKLPALTLSVLLAASLLSTPQLARSLEEAGQAFVDVIVRSSSDSQTQVTRESIRRVGGRVERRIRIIDGYVARVPVHSVASLRSQPGVSAVTPDESVELKSVESYEPG